MLRQCGGAANFPFPERVSKHLLEPTTQMYEKAILEESENEK
jgi:hypothetical protein